VSPKWQWWINGCLFLAVMPSVARSAERETSPPGLPLARIAVPISVDGDLSDPGWSTASVIDTFYEEAFGDSRPPVVKTTALLAYNDQSLYIAFKCEDPDPARIRAPYSDRDGVIATEDFVAVFLDARGDRRSALEFRVNPRGIQADGVYNDTTGSEDFGPDFYYEE
jgi:hypothetical protein